MSVRVVIPLAVLAAVLTVGGCAKSEPAADKPAQTASTTPASAPTAEGLSGEDFLAQAPTLSGSAVTLEKCSLLTTPGSDGTLACRVLDKDGSAIKDANNLPVDIFFTEATLSPEAKAVVKECDTICTVQITGTLSRSTSGTDYLSMTDVALKTTN